VESAASDPDLGGVAPQFQARGEAGFRLYLQTSSSVSKAPSLGFGRLPMQEANPEKQPFRRLGQLVR